MTTRSTISAPDLPTQEIRPLPTVRLPVIDRLTVTACTVPTDAPESDGTLTWDRTTIVLVEATAGDQTGIGYTYAAAAAAPLIANSLAPLVAGQPAADISAIWTAMLAAVRNIGRPGIIATAISAVDNALWDLKARLLQLPLVDLLGAARTSVAAYGSGGFCSYSDERLAEQLSGWATDGFRAVKMKVGRDPSADAHRVDVARAAIGPHVALFVDANGAYDRAAARAAAACFAERDVRWLEEPVSSDDVDGLRIIRDRAPAGMAIAAGEYGWDAFHFARLLDGGAVDVLQADATRCLGVTGFQLAAALCEARHAPLSSHCAPTLHVPLMCATRPAVHVEWFHDHVRIERILFDGAPVPRDGMLAPDRTRPGFGITLNRSEVERFAVWASA